MAEALVGRVAVIVVCHDSGETLGRCVQAVRAQRGVECELVLVDNASRRDPADELGGVPGLRWIRNADNLGFATACNQGAAAASAPWLLFLNPDCFPGPDDLAELVRIASRQPDIGLLGAQLLNADGSEQAASRRRAPTPAAVLGSRSLRVAGTPLSEGVDTVEAISGALMLMPTALFVELGGFDEAYRLHCEDLDLCRRVLASGHQVAIAHDVRVVHVKGTSSRRRPIWVEWQKHRGMWRYFSKFDRARTPVWLTLLLALGLGLRFPLAALRAWWQARLAAR